MVAFVQKRQLVICRSGLKLYTFFIFFFQAEDGIRDCLLSRGLGDVYKRQFLLLFVLVSVLVVKVVAVAAVASAKYDVNWGTFTYVLIYPLSLKNLLLGLPGRQGVVGGGDRGRLPDPSGRSTPASQRSRCDADMYIPPCPAL